MDKQARSRFWKNSNTLLSFAAIFISLVTLFILMYQTNLASRQFNLEQRQQVASVMPYLMIWYGYANDSEFQIIVENLGIGPAFIKKVRTHYKGEVFEDTDYPRLAEVLSNRGEFANYIDVYSNIVGGQVIPSGRQVSHIKVVKDDRPNVYDDVFSADEVELEIEYASIYGERWVVKGRSKEPVKIESIVD